MVAICGSGVARGEADDWDTFMGVLFEVDLALGLDLLAKAAAAWRLVLSVARSAALEEPDLWASIVGLDFWAVNDGINGTDFRANYQEMPMEH